VRDSGKAGGSSAGSWAGRGVVPPRPMREQHSRTTAAQMIAALIVALAPALATVTADAQVTTPPQGSPLRAAILDAVRPRVEAEVGKPVEFVVRQLRVLGEWAFVDLTPQRPGGGAIEYVYSRYQRARDAGAFDNEVVALVRNTPRGWLLYEYALGATDVAWYGWWTAYPVPEQVFPSH
jgi:hypothetical protein